MTHPNNPHVENLPSRPHLKSSHSSPPFPHREQARVVLAAPETHQSNIGPPLKPVNGDSFAERLSPDPQSSMNPRAVPSLNDVGQEGAPSTPALDGDVLARPPKRHRTGLRSTRNDDEPLILKQDAATSIPGLAVSAQTLRAIPLRRHTLHPIHRLPNELLVHAFHLGSVSNPCTFPTLVSQVCNKWRKLALGSRSLWSFIDFSDPPPYYRTQEWLSRSKGTLLDINFSVVGSEEGAEGLHLDTSELDNAIDIVVPELARWGSLSIHLDRQMLQVVLERCSELPCAPKLKELAVLCTDPDEDPMDEQFVLFGEVTPSLRRVRLAGVPFQWSGPLFHSLTHLHLGFYEEEFAPSLEQFTNILEQCPGLEELLLDRTGITTARNSEEYTYRAISLPRLRFTKWASLSKEMYVLLSRFISAPATETYVGYGGHYDPEFQESIESLLRRCPFPGLKKLRLEYSKICVPVLLRMLEVMKGLVEVELFQCLGLSEQVFQALVWRNDGSGQLCPKLRSIRLELCEGFTIDQLKDVVVSRQRDEAGVEAPAPLERVTLIKCDRIFKEDGHLEWFEERVQHVTWENPTPTPFVRAASSYSSEL